MNCLKNAEKKYLEVNNLIGSENKIKNDKGKVKLNENINNNNENENKGRKKCC